MALQIETVEERELSFNESFSGSERFFLVIGCISLGLGIIFGIGLIYYNYIL